MTQLTLLRNRVSPETAFIIQDYPYGRRLRCRKRVWLHHARGRTRLMEQTENPITRQWNKPHAGAYYDFMVLCLDNSTGYITIVATGPFTDTILSLLATGIYAQFNQQEKDGFMRVVAQWRHYNPTCQRRIAAMFRHCRAQPDAPDESIVERVRAELPSDTGVFVADVLLVRAALEAERATNCPLPTIC